MSQPWQYLFHVLVFVFLCFFFPTTGEITWVPDNLLKLVSLTRACSLYGRKKSCFFRSSEGVLVASLKLLLMRKFWILFGMIFCLCYPVTTLLTFPSPVGTQQPSLVLGETTERAEGIALPFCYTGAWCVLRNPVKMYMRAEMLI